MRFLFDYGASQREVIKEAALEVMMVLCVNPLYGAEFSSIPYSMFDGFKYLFA